MKIGTIEIQKVYLGTTELEGLYIGTNQAYKPSSGGIDANTVLMAHFDDSVADSSQYNNTVYVQGSVTPTYTTGKFNNAISMSDSKYVRYTCSNDLFKNIAKTTCTIDFWLKNETLESARLALMETANGNTCMKIIRSISEGVLTIGSDYNTVTCDLSGIASGAWFHIAITNYVNPEDSTKKKLDVYLNGVYQNSFPYSATNTGNCARISVTGVNIDEYRVSDIIRYNGNFTPPTGPYTN